MQQHSDGGARVKSGVWRYQLTDSPSWKTFTGSPITKAEAWKFLLMHWPVERIKALEPGEIVEEKPQVG